MWGRSPPYNRFGPAHAPHRVTRLDGAVLICRRELRPRDPSGGHCTGATPVVPTVHCSGACAPGARDGPCVRDSSELVELRAELRLGVTSTTRQRWMGRRKKEGQGVGRAFRLGSAQFCDDVVAVCWKFGGLCLVRVLCL